jgi:hypothetical protein
MRKHGSVVRKSVLLETAMDPETFSIPSEAYEALNVIIEDMGYLEYLETLRKEYRTYSDSNLYI